MLVKILAHEFYVVRGLDNTKTLFNDLWACISIPFVKLEAGYAPGLPHEALRLYGKGDSGGSLVPRREHRSSLEPS